MGKLTRELPLGYTEGLVCIFGFPRFVASFVSSIHFCEMEVGDTQSVLFYFLFISSGNGAINAPCTHIKFNTNVTGNSVFCDCPYLQM